MKLHRSLSHHQKYVLRALAKGDLTITYDRESDTVGIQRRNDVAFSIGRVRSKTRGRNLSASGDHLRSSIIELRQRGILVEQEGQLVLCREAQHQFGAPPEEPPPKRFVRMSRTRAARMQ